MFSEVTSILVTTIGSAMAIIVGIVLRRIAQIKLVTQKNFRDMQEEQRKLHDEHFVLQKDFDAFILKQDIINKQHKVFICRGEFERFIKERKELLEKLGDKIIGREAFFREFDKLEKAHNDDMVEVYKQIKGGFESITTRIDNLKDK